MGTRRLYGVLDSHAAPAASTRARATAAAVSADASIAVEEKGHGNFSRPPSELRVSSADMYEALVKDMVESPDGHQLEEWRQTVRQLFVDVYNSAPFRSEELPETRKRFPSSPWLRPHAL